MSKMRLEQITKTAHPCVYPGMKREFVDAFLDRGTNWLRIDHIPWHENPLVIWELETIKKRGITCTKRRAHEWRYKGKIFHRDVFNHVWQKSEGKMIWIGKYNPHTDTIDHTAKEPK